MIELLTRLQAKAAKMFALVDKDGDGQLTEEELKQARASVSDEHCHATTDAPCVRSLVSSLPTRATRSSTRATHERRLGRCVHEYSPRT